MIQTKTEKIKNDIELYSELELFPDVFQSIKDSLLSGNGYWYPLEIEYLPEFKAVVYDLDRIYKRGRERIELLREVFEIAGIRRIKGFHPYLFEGQSTWLDIPDIKDFLYEQDENGHYNFNWILEEYYYDASEEWIVYVSHEADITFCGDKLASAAEQVIPAEFRRCVFNA